MMISVCCGFIHTEHDGPASREHDGISKWPLSFWARQKSSLIFISLYPCTQICTCCNRLSRQNSFPCGLSRKICLSQLFKHIRVVLDSQQCPICLLSLAHHAQSQYTQSCTHTRIHRYWIMDDTPTVGWYICHISTSIQSQACRGCPSLYHLKFTFCHLTSAAGVHAGPERWCLTAATLNQDCGCWHRTPEDHQGYPWADELV